MKYLRYYNRAIQLTIFLLLILTIGVLGYSMIVTLVPLITGVPMASITNITDQTPLEIIRVAIVSFGMGNLFMFMIPSLIFAYLMHPEPLRYLGIHKVKPVLFYILPITLMLGAIPVLQLIQHFMSLLPFSAELKASQAEQEKVTQALMKMPQFTDFAKAFLIMAIVPAIGEELFFRGIFMRFIDHATKNRYYATFFSAIIFSYAHSNVYGLLSIFLAGSILAYIYYVTGSLICSMIAHLSFNGVQIISEYITPTVKATQATPTYQTSDYLIIIGGTALFIVSLLLLQKMKQPLPKNWSDNFDTDPSSTTA